LEGEAEGDGFLFEADGEAGVDFEEDGIAEGDDLGGGGAAAVDDGEDVFGGEAGAAEGEAFAEACVLEEPCGGELDGWGCG
jgi:hypothetical protein